MTRPTAAPPLPRGYAFPIAELQTLQRWAERHALYLSIELDRCIEGEDYEEVLALTERRNRMRRWTLWRSAEHVVVEPLTGPAVRFARLADALTALRG